MRRLLRRMEFLRSAFWGARLAAGLPARTPDEIVYRLRRERRRRASSAPRLFRFPWGEFEFVSPGNLLSQYREIYIDGQYAFTCDGRAPVILDCGGNIGLSGVWFKQNYPDARLTVYEADPAIAEIARRNLRRAGFDDVDVRSEAVWIADGEIGFDPKGGDSGTITEDSDSAVRAISLAEHLPERVDLLKLDIEGAEFAVLNDLCETGAIRRVNRIVAEFHITRESTDAFLAVLARLRSEKMEIAFGSAVPGPYFGRATTAAPFGAIRDYNVLCEVYAWRADTSGSGGR